MFAKALNHNLNLQRLRSSTSAGTTLQSSAFGSQISGPGDPPSLHSLSAHDQILEGAYHFLIIIEHDPLLYEDAQGMVEYVSQGLHDAAKEAAVLLYSPGTDTFLEDMNRNADRVFYFDEGPRAATKLISKTYPKAQKSQRTLEAFT
jgi:hypothetical protein